MPLARIQADEVAGDGGARVLHGSADAETAALIRLSAQAGGHRLRGRNDTRTERDNAAQLLQFHSNTL
jgi:hypothetical protein